MSRPSSRTIVVATLGGIIHLATVEVLFRRLRHAPEILWPLASIDNAAPLFIVGFLAVLVTMHTRLLAPTIGVAAVLSWATYREVTTPMPEWSELGGHLVVDGPVFLSSYRATWYVWLALFAVAAGIEFGLRSRYELGSARLRHVPSLPDDPRGAGVVAGIVGGVFGLAVTVWANGIGVNPPMIVPILAVTTAVAAAVPVGAAIHRGLIAPTVCFAVFVVPGLLRQTFTASEGGPVFLLLLGPIAVVFVLLGYAEFFVRIRLRGRFGGWLDAIL